MKACMHTQTITCITGQNYDDISTWAMLVRSHISKECSRTEMPSEIWLQILNEIYWLENEFEYLLKLFMNRPNVSFNLSVPLILLLTKRWIAKTYVALSHFPPWQELCTHGNSWGKIGSQMHCLLVNCLQEDISSFSRQCQVFHIAMLQRLHAFVSMWPSQFSC